MATIKSLLQGTPLAPHVQDFQQAGRKYGVDPRLLVSIAGAESSFGKQTLGDYNPFGWGPGRSFPSFRDAIFTVAAGLKHGYINQGLRTPEQIARKWAPVGAGNDPTDLNSNWVSNVEGFLSQLGGKASVGGGAAAVGTASMQPPPADVGASYAQSVLRDLREGDYNPQRSLRELAALTSLAPGGQTDTTDTFTEAPKPVGTWGKWVKLASGADRSGVHTVAPVLQFVGSLGRRYGRPLTIGTGTNHNEYVIGTHRESQHWTGHAADIPASGAKLTRLGRLALVQAGMSRSEARKATGGIYNIGRYQIIFNTTEGGNHWNHLHVGVR